MRKVVIDALLFVVSAASAIAFAWSPKELVWGLWLSSLVVGFTTIVIGVVAAAARRPGELLRPPGRGTTAPPAVDPTDLPAVARMLLGAGILAFFTFHFGMFHFVHGCFLESFFPLDESGATDLGFFALAAHFGDIVAIGWPLALTTLIGSIDELKRALTRFDVTSPYRSVVRMHFFIIGYGFLQVLGLSSSGVTVVVLAIYWFPFELLRERKRPAGEASAAPG